MLLAIADDLDRPQDDEQQSRKSEGQADSQESPAEVHGVERHASGFSVSDTLSEFRALRATVVALWTQATPSVGEAEMKDLTRFNEAIDQAVAESMTSYAAEKELHTALIGAILQASPDPIYVLDLAGRFTYANKATQLQYGLPEEAIIGKSALTWLSRSPHARRHLQIDAPAP